MSNRIRNIHVKDHSLVPAEAELRLTVELEQITPTTEVRGRLMGPRCRYSSTVEVAYPLRPVADTGPLRRGFRVIIPEACMWDPVSPFLYEGPVELCEEGRRVDQVHVSHGLRSLSMGPKGLRVNGQLLALRGREVVSATEEQLLALRAEGVNLLVTPAANADLWEMADRLGFLVLDQASQAEGQKHPCALDLANIPSQDGPESLFNSILRQAGLK